MLKHIKCISLAILEAKLNKTTSTDTQRRNSYVNHISHIYIKKVF